MLRVIGSLVCRVDEYPVVKRHCHRCLRLQEGVFCPGGLIMIGHLILCPGDCLACVSPYQMFMGQYISAFMNLWSAFFKGLEWVEYPILHFIVHFHQALRLFQHFHAFRCHQADGIPQIMSHSSYRDQGIPILLQMAHLDIAGNVIGGKYAYDPLQFSGLLCMNRQHPGPGILGSDRACVDHAIQIDVIRVFPRPQHLFSRVDPLHGHSHRNLSLLFLHRQTFS